MWEALVIFGVVTVASVTAITLKVLAFVERSDTDAEKRHTEKLTKRARNLELSYHPIDLKEADRLRAEISKRISAEKLAKIARADKLEAAADKLDANALKEEERGFTTGADMDREEAQEIRRRAMKLREEVM